MDRKLTKAARMCALSKFPRTWTATINAIPGNVLAACTASQISDIAAAMRRQYEIGYEAGWQEAQP